jgi:hypothetical protein
VFAKAKTNKHRVRSTSQPDGMLRSKANPVSGMLCVLQPNATRDPP